MTSDTRGPQHGRVPPHVRDRLQQKKERQRQRERLGPPWRRWWAIGGYAALALLIGFGVGWSLQSDPLADALDVVRSDVMPVGFQADSIWTLGTGGNPAIGEALTALASQDDPSTVDEASDAWLASYDEVMANLAAAEVPAAGAGIWALFNEYVQVSRDAVQVLAVAAGEQGELRDVLVTEVQRLRGRAQSILQEARASVRSLEAAVLGQPVTPGPDTVVPPSQPPLRPSPAASPEPGTSPTAESSPDADPTPDGTAPAPSPT